MHIPTGEIVKMSQSEFLNNFKKDCNKYESIDQRTVDRKNKMTELTPKEATDLLPLTTKRRKGWMKNQPCVCGSGRKFKRCCWSKFK